MRWSFGHVATLLRCSGLQSFTEQKSKTMQIIEDYHLLQVSSTIHWDWPKSIWQIPSSMSSVKTFLPQLVDCRECNLSGIDTGTASYVKTWGVDMKFTSTRKSHLDLSFDSITCALILVPPNRTTWNSIQVLLIGSKKSVNAIFCEWYYLALGDKSSMALLDLVLHCASRDYQLLPVTVPFSSSSWY